MIESRVWEYYQSSWGTCLIETTGRGDRRLERDDEFSLITSRSSLKEKSPCRSVPHHGKEAEGTRGKQAIGYETSHSTRTFVARKRRQGEKRKTSPIEQAWLRQRYSQAFTSLAEVLGIYSTQREEERRPQMLSWNSALRGD